MTNKQKEIIVNDSTLIALGVTAVIAVSAVVVTLAYQEHSDWEAFKSKHNCKVVATVKGELFNTYSWDAKGNFIVGIGSTSAKQGWLCDDGVTYYR